MTLTVTYRLLSLEFRGVRIRAMFNGALLKHEARRVLLVDGDSTRSTPHQAVIAYLDRIDGRELRSIRYLIIATDPRTKKRVHAPIPFCHDFPRGTGVHLVLAGLNALALEREGGRRFFSDQFTLASVTNDRIPSDQRAFQFHE